MSHPSILALGYSEAAMVMRAEAAGKIKAIISIYGAREFQVDAPDVLRRLDLRFDDVDALDSSDDLAFHRAWAQRKWAAEMGKVLVPPTLEDARAIVEFARSVRDVEGVVLCQCGAGMSRAPAAALLCLATWTGAGREDDCVAELKRMRPAAVPLMGLVRFGDEVLGREGRLVRAVLQRRGG